MTTTIASSDSTTPVHPTEKSPQRRGHLRIIVSAALVVVAVIVVAVFALSGGSATKAKPNQVQATETDALINLSSNTAKVGQVTFQITNKGTQPHEFVVFRTDVAAGNLPLLSNGRVNEDSTLLHNVIDSGGDIAPGSSATFGANLAAGHYVVVCNLPLHYRLGMHADFIVK
jgi:uncharacterized cupredoxin-like copper-binding protein